MCPRRPSRVDQYSFPKLSRFIGPASGTRFLRHSDRPVDTDPAVSTVDLVAIPAGCSKAIEIPFPPLSLAIKRLQGLNEALHAEPGRNLSILQARAYDSVAVKTDGPHFSAPALLDYRRNHDDAALSPSSVHNSGCTVHERLTRKMGRVAEIRTDPAVLL